MRCDIEENGEETDTLRDNLNDFWNVERASSSGEWVINELEKDIFHNDKKYIKYSPSHLSMIYLSHNCNFYQIQLEDLRRLLSEKSLIGEYNEALKECENNTNTESVPDTKVCKASRNFITFHTG